MSVMGNGEPRCGGLIRYELWCNVKCDVYVNMMRCGMLQFQPEMV